MQKKDLLHKNNKYSDVNVGYTITVATNLSTIQISDMELKGEDLAQLKNLYIEGKIKEGLSFAQHLLKPHPKSSEVLKYLGVFFLMDRQPQKAMEFMQKALAIESDNHEIHAHLGMIHFNLNDMKNAEKECLHALKLNPDFGKAYANLALIKKTIGDKQASIKYFEKALELTPNAASTHINFGNLLRELGFIKKAQQHFNAALVEASTVMSYAIFNNLGACSSDLGNYHQAQKYYNKALKINPSSAETFSNMLMELSLDNTLTSEDIYLKHVEYSQHYETASAVNAFTHNQQSNTNKRLKIGFVSADLRKHPVSFFLESLFQSLNPNLLDITLFSTNIRQDDLTQRLKKMPLNWVDLCGLNSQQMASKIHADNIDILIDLSGHTAQNSLQVFTYKPAPIQVTWIGYFNTSGLQSMDYIFCDEFVIPPGNECFYTEKPFRFEEGYLCFTPPENDIRVKSLPALKNTSVTFGCFNQLKKMGEEVVELWAKILLRVPDSKLFLKSAALDNTNQAHDETLEKFKKCGISPNRIIMQGRSSRTDYFETYNKVDIALDPFPYVGGTTTVEALWMGVPVVTLQGIHYVSRMGVSIMNTVHLNDWVATDKENYINIAVSKASDLNELSSLRATLRERMLRSPLCDAPRFARKLEKSLYKMWADYCEPKTHN
jgi:protein O-GlcNAc transferase